MIFSAYQPARRLKHLFQHYLDADRRLHIRKEVHTLFPNGYSGFFLDFGSLRKLALLLVFALFSTSPGYSQDPTFEWVFNAGAATTFSGGYGIGHDDLGNVYTTGRFTGSIDFDPGAGTAILTSAGAQDTYITKVDAGGNLVWARRVGGTDDVYSFDLSADEAGNVYVTGAFRGTADFDPMSGGKSPVNWLTDNPRPLRLTRLDSDEGTVPLPTLLPLFPKQPTTM